MSQNQKWLDWAVELQALAQAGLYYSKDIYDIERFQRIRDIAADMLVSPSGLPAEKVKELFCSEIGYQTPKLDSRAAVFLDDKILLVQEQNGRWSLPAKCFSSAAFREAVFSPTQKPSPAVISP